MGENNYSNLENLLLEDEENPTSEGEESQYWAFKKSKRQRIHARFRKHGIVLLFAACVIIVVLTVVSFSVSMLTLQEYTRKSHDVNLQSNTDKLQNKLDELEKKINIIEQEKALLQSEHRDLEKEATENKNSIGNLLNTNNNLVSKMAIQERTTFDLKRRLEDIQNYLYSMNNKKTNNGTDHISKPSAWITLLMLIASFIVLYC